MDDQQIRRRIVAAVPDPGPAPTSTIVRRGRRRVALTRVAAVAVVTVVGASTAGVVLASRPAPSPVVEPVPTASSSAPTDPATPTASESPTASASPSSEPSASPEPRPSPTSSPRPEAEATPPALTEPSPSPSSESADPGVVLEGDGLGVVAVGEPYEAAAAALRAHLGEPRHDTGWTDTRDTQAWFGVCAPTQYWRGLQWGQLAVVFTATDPAGADGGPLTSWGYGSSHDVGPDPTPLVTDAGLGVGDTRDRAVALYGDRVTYVPGDEVVPPRLAIDDGTSERPLSATLDRADHQTIQWFNGGEPCGE